MAIQTRDQLKAWFRRGLYPTEGQFADWIDSFRHKLESIAMSDITGLTEALNKKYDSSEAKLLETSVKQVLEKMEGIATEMEDMRELMKELKNTLTDRAYTLDFADGAVNAVQDVNMEDEEVKVIGLRLYNVAKLYVTTGDMVRHEVDPDNCEEVRIAAGGLATWEIERASDAAAAVGIKCRRTGESSASEAEE